MLFRSERNELLTDDAINKGAQGSMLPVSRIIHPERFTPIVATDKKHINHRVISQIVDSVMNVHGSAIHLIENKVSKTRTCILAYNLCDEFAWGFGIRKQQWRCILDWLGKTTFPVWVDKAMDIWPILYKVDNDNRSWIGLINFGHDEANDMTLHVKTRGMSKVRFVNEKGTLTQIPKKYLNFKKGLLRISFSADYSVKPFDTMLLVIEPM